MKSPLLDIENLHTHFFSIDGVRKAVNGVTLRMSRGELVGLAGESGCGKSTTALSILNLIPHPGKIVSGKITLKGNNVLKLSESEMRAIRGKDVSMIFQEPMTSLSPVHSVGTQLTDVITHQMKISRADAYDKALEMLELVRIPNPNEIIKTHPHQLSGGMRQRVMIAMALSCNPDLLIADEPTSALDTITQLEIIKLLEELENRLGMALLLISHNLYLIARMCKRTAIMYMGSIVEDIDTINLFKNPEHPYTRGLMKSIPRYKGKITKFETIYGDVPDLLYMPTGCPFHPRCNYSMPICKRKKPKLAELTKNHSIACHLYH